VAAIDSSASSEARNENREVTMKVVFALFVSFMLVSCGGDQGSPGDTAGLSRSDAEIAAEYQKKVQAKVSESMVNSFQREWGVTEDEARCVIENIDTVDLMQVETDPEVQAKLKACGVDPAVVK